MFSRSKKPEKTERREPSDGLWLKCKSCNEILFRGQLERNLFVCPKCGYHFRINSRRYIEILLDGGVLEETIAPDLAPKDPLNFKGYKEKLLEAGRKSSLRDAAVGGTGRIHGVPVVLFAMDFTFMGGSMGSVVGEKFCRSADRALELEVPFVCLATSGGARMQEGVVSLMQLSKTITSVIALSRAKLPYINILVDPTTAGVMASFASIGDVQVAEPGALLGFTGPRVIRDTLKVDLPPGFQRSEFLLDHGLIDVVVPRKELKSVVHRLLTVLWKGNDGES
jgi:acetyl-CoA carboxylase carboxyl transferase subunit beta